MIGNSQSSSLKAVGSLTIREGKAHSDLMRVRMRRVELYLASRARTQKARGRSGANTLVSDVLGVRGLRLEVAVLTSVL